MILVLGGTTEGRKAVQVLEEAGAHYYYATKGKTQEVEMSHGTRLTGAMDAATLISFCREKKIRLLIDAAHPFAVHIHQNVQMAACELQIPVIRYERQYPPHTDDIVWCKDYQEAVTRLQMTGVTTLLALTGVQTIGKLKAYWQSPTTSDCWFRILNRRESQLIARREGFPADHLVYYQEEDTASLIQQLHPQAILTKESGKSGGFEEKIRAAKEAGVTIFVVCRPQTVSVTGGDRCMMVNGPYGLRRKVEKLLPEFFPLKTGLTSGTCATAAAIAALTKEHTVMVRLPNGEDIDVDVASIEGDTATVIKDAGDDPDITDGLAICATVRLLEMSQEKGRKTLEEGDECRKQIVIKGGEGVGTVTLPGLGLPIGAPAINEIPRRMIHENLMSHISRLQIHPAVEVTITVPEGRTVGRRTFNPRIGIVDGISIIGTHGIVKPFSSDAWINSIRKEMAVGYALTSHLSPADTPQIVINSGARSEQYLRDRYPQLPEQAFVHYGNYIGETLRIAADLDVKHVVMGLMIGKGVKLAEGNLNTHSHQVTMNRDFIQQMIDEAGIPVSSLRTPLTSLNMARELWTLLSENDMCRLAQVIIGHCHHHCDALLPHGQLDILLISDRGVIYMGT